jgi:hypothetical protein
MHSKRFSVFFQIFKWPCECNVSKDIHSKILCDDCLIHNRISLFFNEVLPLNRIHRVEDMTVDRFLETWIILDSILEDD